MSTSNIFASALGAGQLATMLLIVGVWVGDLASEKQVLLWLDDAEKQRDSFIEIQKAQQMQINTIIQQLMAKDATFNPVIPGVVMYR